MAFKSDEERRAYAREYNKGWYQRHKERLREKRKQHDEELKQWLRQYKSQFCCAECGESHPACLQFHHRNKEGKSFNIGSIVGRWRYITLKNYRKRSANVTYCVATAMLYIIGEKHIILMIGERFYHLWIR